MLPYGVTGPQWANMTVESHKKHFCILTANSHLRSSAAETPFKFQSDVIILKPDLTA